MRSSGGNGDFDNTTVDSPLEHATMAHRWLAVRSRAVDIAQVRVGNLANGLVDGEAIGHLVAAGQGEINFANLPSSVRVESARAQLLTQASLCQARSRQKHEPRRPSTQPMDGHGCVVGILSPKLMQQRMLEKPAAWQHRKSRGLRNDEQIRVFMEHVERQGHGRLLPARTVIGEQLSSLQADLSGGDLAVQGDLSCVDAPSPCRFAGVRIALGVEGHEGEPGTLSIHAVFVAPSSVHNRLTRRGPGLLGKRRLVPSPGVVLSVDACLHGGCAGGPNGRLT